MKKNWDNVKSEDAIIIREMLYDDPKRVVKKYGKQRLKSILLENFFKFDRKNLNFWKLILNIDDNEFNSHTNKSFRANCKIWNY